MGITINALIINANSENNAVIQKSHHLILYFTMLRLKYSWYDNKIKVPLNTKICNADLINSLFMFFY